MVKRFIPIGIVIIFALISIAALLHKGFYPSHDGEYHIVRFYEFYKTFSSGELYPRWAVDLNNGYGAPLFSYVYPLPNYLAVFLYSIGISFIDGYKVQMIIASILGAIFFYFWSKQFFNSYTSVATSTIYTFSPYHFVDIYIRGSIGEVWALALFPAFLWAVTALIRTQKKRFFAFAAIFLSAIIFSHNILSLMFFPFAIIYIAIMGVTYEIKRQQWYVVVLLIFLSLGMSAVFWIPALFEQHYVQGLQIYNITEMFPELYQLLIPSWGSGFATGDLQNQLSYQLGAVNILAVFLAGCIFFIKLRKRYKEKFIILFFLLSFFICLFLMLSYSLVIWKTVPFMKFFQFPWRLLSLTILVSSFLAGSISFVRGGTYIALFLAFLAVLLSYGYARPAYYHQRDDMYYLSKSNFMDGTNSPGNVFNTVWFTGRHKKESQKIKLLKGEGTVRQISIKPTQYVFDIDAQTDVQILINTTYFPGWSVSEQTKKISISEYKGLMIFSLTRGRYLIKVALEQTRIQQFALFCSVVSLFSLIYFVRIRR